MQRWIMEMRINGDVDEKEGGYKLNTKGCPKV